MMGFLAKLLGTVGSGGWLVYAIIGAVVFGAGAASGYWAKSKLDVPVIAQLKTDIATSQLDAQKARTAYSEQQKQTALDLAAANASALVQNQALQARIAVLSTKAARAEQARQQASTKLLDTLKAIPNEQKATLSPGVLSYLAGVRSQQAAAPGAPASDHPN